MRIKNRGPARAASHKKRFPIVAAFFVALFFITGIFGASFVPHDPIKMTLSLKYMPPFFMEGGSAEHILGTDALGRDILSRIISGCRVSMIVSLVAIVLGCAVGTLLGMLSGYYGGAVDIVMMRLTDASLSFPSMLLALLLALALGPGFKGVIISIAFSLWSKYARMIRGEVLTLKQQNYVTQARIIGASNLRIMVRHILPNLLNTIIVMATLEIGMTILSESSLSFLGLSIAPPAPSWGSMISEGNSVFARAWWISTFPAVAIVLTVLSFTSLGEWLKSRLGEGGRY